jgi:hypothetical protein
VNAESDDEDQQSVSTKVSTGSAFVEPLSTSTQPLSVAYRELDAELRRQGFYTPNYWFYARRLAVHAALLASAVTLVVTRGDQTPCLVLAAALMGACWHGLSFIAHDAGHHAVSGDRKKDGLFGVLLAGFVGGLSVGWYVSISVFCLYHGHSSSSTFVQVEIQSQRSPHCHE